MNFLAHLHLSGDRPLVIVGNFMADAVKGRDLERFPEEVRQGIRLHRAIDHYTDNHPLPRAGRERVRAQAGRYSGVVMDLFYDHLLAAHWKEVRTEPLNAFAVRMYAILSEQASLMEGRPARMLPHMISGDWLSGYATLEGIGDALRGLSRRAPQGHVMAGAEAVLKEHYAIYHEEFLRFLRDVERETAPLR